MEDVLAPTPNSQLPAPAVVIGGGLAGLSVAALLARQGRPVVLLERGRRLGGRALAVRRDGFTLDLGAHLLLGGTAHPLAGLLDRLGLDLPLAPVRPGQVGVLRAQGPVRLPLTRAAVLRSPLFPPLARLRLLLLLRRAQVDDPRGVDALSLGAWLRERSGDGELIERLLGLAGLVTLASATADLSAGHVLDLVRTLARGRPVLAQIVGGWGRLIDSLAATLTGHGGQIRLGCPAEQLLLEGGRVRGVVTRAGELAAEAVVATVPVQRLRRLAPRGSPLEDELQPRAGQEPISLLGLDVALSRRARADLALLYDPIEQILLVDPSLNDRSLAPPGGQLVQLLALTTPREVADAGVRAGRYAALDGLLDGHLPGWREAAVFRRRLRLPLAVGVRHHYEQHRASLLGPRSVTTGGLFFAGDGTAGHGALAGVAIDSAMRAAEAVLAESS